MNEKTVAGYCIMCNDQGYLTDLEQWNKEIGLEIAEQEDINMTDTRVPAVSAFAPGPSECR